MDMICKDTQDNLQYLLLHDTPNDLIELETPGKDDGFYVHGMEYWHEPLAWVYHEAAYGGYAHRLLKHFEKHLKVIFNMEKRGIAALIHGQIYIDTEKKLNILRELSKEEEKSELYTDEG